jgi:hypothetical protein
MIVHYTPNPNPSDPRHRVALCGLLCIAGGGDGKASGSSAIENVDCRACLEMSKNVQLELLK